MDDRFAKLTQNELKMLVLLEYSTDYDKKSQVDKLTGMISEKKIFETEIGLAYEKAFFEYAKTNRTPFNCVACEKQLDRMDRFMCPACRKKLEEAAKGIKEKSSKQEKEGDAKQSKQRKTIRIKRNKKEKANKSEANKPGSKSETTGRRSGKSHIFLGIIIGILLTFAVIGVLYYMLVVRNQKAVTKADISDFSKKYDENLKEYGYSIGDCTIGEDGSLVYELLPQSDALIVYPDDNNKVDSISLVMSGSDEASQIQQMMLISLLNVTIYKDTDVSVMMDLLQEMIESGGEYTYRGYNWNLIPTEEATYYFLSSDDGRIEDKGSYSNEAPKEDITDLLDGDYLSTEARFGESTAIIAENTRYYPTSGVSAVYDLDTYEIIYIDEDGTGNDGIQYGIFGVYCGMTKEEVANALRNINLGTSEESEDVWVYVSTKDGGKREFAIEFENDKVVLISYKEVN